MKVFVPFTNIQTATLKCLAREPYSYTPVKMVAENDYLTYFRRRWEEGNTFVNCEHDSLFHEGAIQQLVTCPEDWCAFATSPGETIVWEKKNENTFTIVDIIKMEKFIDGGIPPFALVKFGASFIEKHPDVWDGVEAAEKEWWDMLRMPRWMYLDSWLEKLMHEEGIVCHQHFPDIINANPLRDG